MRILIQNGYILSLDAQDRVFEQGDIFIDGTKIVKIGNNLDAARLNPDKVIDARNKLVAPGLVNADLHAAEVLTKGLYENNPLEFRPDESDQSTVETVYMAALLAGIEALKTGVSTVQDHWRFSPIFAKEGTTAVLDAYNLIGLRTNLAVEIDANGDGVEQVINAYEDVLNNIQAAKRDRLRITISPPEPLLANERFVKWLKAISERRNIAIHFHFNQTKRHVFNAMETFQGLTAIEQADKMGLLTPQASVSSAVWVTPAEINMLANRGVTVIHTPLSDLYTGSGVLPVHLLLEAGVRVGLGSGESCGGNLNLFDAMKMTASIHRIVQPDYNRWVSVEQALLMATHGSAHACQLDGQIGQIAEGCSADLVLYSLKGFSFSPLNNPKDQLVCLENGSSVDTVLVNGDVVVEGRKVIAVDEAGALQQFRKQFQQSKRSLEHDERPIGKLESDTADSYHKYVSEPMQIRRWADNPVLDSRLKQTFTKKG
jgi:5-methylthioadenosine/S-adenosylhomocysteine deaminase